MSDKLEHLLILKKKNVGYEVFFVPEKMANTKLMSQEKKKKIAGDSLVLEKAHVHSKRHRSV